jgi:hypothetical protein
VILDDGSEIKYDVLCLATGSRYENHPWLFKSDKTKVSAELRKRLSKLSVDIPNHIKSEYQAYIELSSGLCVAIYMVEDFLAGEHGDLLRFYVEARAYVAILIAGRRMTISPWEQFINYLFVLVRHSAAL